MAKTKHTCNLWDKRTRRDTYVYHICHAKSKWFRKNSVQKFFLRNTTLQANVFRSLYYRKIVQTTASKHIYNYQSAYIWLHMSFSKQLFNMKSPSQLYSFSRIYVSILNTVNGHCGHFGLLPNENIHMVAHAKNVTDAIAFPVTCVYMFV